MNTQPGTTQPSLPTRTEIAEILESERRSGRRHLAIIAQGGMDYAPEGQYETENIIEILGNRETHPHGIKVRFVCDSGIERTGRVTAIGYENVHEMKLTAISVNGDTVFIKLPVDDDGKVRADLVSLFNLNRYTCVSR